jgi:DNA-binding CsgD family transcriptional regulator
MQEGTMGISGGMSSSSVDAAMRGVRATPLGGVASASAGTGFADDGVDRYVSQGVELAMQVAQLPAIPTASWCREAAKVISPIGDYQRALVAVARTSHDGMLIEEVVSVGVHVPGGHAEHMEEALLRLRRAAWLPPHTAVDMTRSWATTIDGDAMRRTQAAGWNMSISPFLIVAAAPFGEVCDGYALILAIGTSDSGSARSAMLPTVKALANLLAKRARVALGCPDKPIRWISPREQQVLELLIEGMSVKEIGETLGRSPHTITDHLKSLHRKLEANSRGELVSKALGRHSSRGGAARTHADEGMSHEKWQ